MWWPPPLTGEDRVPLVFEGAQDLPDWYYIGLVVVVGGFWLAAYVLAIWVARVTGYNGIPAVAAALNIGWELNNSFVVDHSAWQRPFNFAWFLLDLVIVSQVLKYGPRDFPSLAVSQFRRYFVAVLVFGMLLIPAVELEIGDYYGAYTGLALNTVMSLAFVLMLRRRRSSAGQSMYIALSKGIGSALGVLMSVSLYPQSLVLPVLGAAVIILDTYYAVSLYRQFRQEGASPWALRPRVGLPSPPDVPAPVRA